MIAADGVFSNESDLEFHEAILAQDDITDTQERIQKRVLQYFCRRGFFTRSEVETMLTYENSGFSLDASVRVESFEIKGLERLIRYCARPPFKSENLRWHGKMLESQYPAPCT